MIGSNDRNSRVHINSELAKYNYRNVPVDSPLIPIYNGEPQSYFAYVNNEGQIGMVFIHGRKNVNDIRKYFFEVKKILKRNEIFFIFLSTFFALTGLISN